MKRVIPESHWRAYGGIPDQVEKVAEMTRDPRGIRAILRRGRRDLRGKMHSTWFGAALSAGCEDIVAAWRKRHGME